LCVEQAMLLSLFGFLLGERPAEPRRDDRRDCLPDDKVLNDPRGHGRLLLCSLVLGTVDRPPVAFYWLLALRDVSHAF